MKLLFMISLISLNVFASGSSVGNFSVINPQLTNALTGGNGGLRPEERIVNLQIIANLNKVKADPTIRIIHGTPSLNGVSRISVGRINQNQWQVQTIDIPDDLLIKSDLSQEIQKSIELNDWVEIQPKNP